MGKLISYLAIMYITLIIFHFAGLVGQTPNGYLLEFIKNGTLDTFKGWVLASLAALATLAAVGGVIFSGLMRSGGGIVESAAMTVIAITVLIPQVLDIGSIAWKIMQYGAVAQFLGVVILIPLMLLSILIVLEWVRVKD